jgi:hypothetical protein
MIIIIIIIILIIITRFDCVWMQTQKFPNNPISEFRAPTNSSLQNHLISIFIEIRPLTIWRFCWQPFWKWWPHRNDPDCKFHHYQPIPHFKIPLDINFHWNRRQLTIWRFFGGHFGNGGIVKMTLNANFINTNQLLTSK